MSATPSIKSIVKRNGRTVRYDRSRIATAILKAMTSVGTADPTRADTLAGEVEAALVQTYGAGKIPSVEDIQDVVESVLIENRLTKMARDYIIYRLNRARIRASKSRNYDVKDNVPYKKLYQILLWNMEHGCDSVTSLNRIITGGKFAGLVKEADERYDREVQVAADHVIENLENTRLVIVAGPSSSGKTTTMIKLAAWLKKAGATFRAINLDHYFFDLDQHPRDEFGDYDYETPHALDLELINTHIGRLLDGDKIKTPHYDFKTGLRKLNVHEMKLKPHEILLIDSLHGLYGDMTRSVPSEHKFRLYIEAMGQFIAADGTMMRWADNRLLRRMIRDKDFRNLTPIATLTHWHYVRRSELTNIIPFIGNADAIVNSALPYELPLLKRRLSRYISMARRRFGDDPKRLDAHIRANRVYDLLRPIKRVKDESCVPPNSLLREFIGGSRYRY